MPVYRVSRFAVALALVLAGAAVRPAAQDPVPAATYARDVRPILDTHCTICHAAGGSAPMALTTYDDVRPWAEQIKAKALSRAMPKWHAARGFGAFANDPTLTPFELAQLVAWVDGGAPPGADTSAARRRIARSSAGAASAAEATDADVRSGSGWITGWTFTPGDQLITSATLTSRDGTLIGSWVAGDRPVRLPANGAIRILSPIHVHLERRQPASDERPSAAAASRLRLSWFPRPREGEPPPPRPRRVWTEHVRCGSFTQTSDAQALAIRPILNAGGSAQIVFERLGGAPPVLAGWFRDFDPLYPRTYWFETPIDLAGGARVSGDGPCEADLILTGRRATGR